MGLRGYRLSVDEQQKEQDVACRKARLCRLAAVRQQSEVSQSGQLSEYKTRLADAEATAKQQLTTTWELKRDATMTALHLRYNREQQLLGKAQREALRWTRTDIHRQWSTESQRKSRNVDAHRRFQMALRLLRQRKEDSRRPTRILVQSRKQEQQRSRRLANANVASKSPRKPAEEQMLRLSTVKGTHLEIDFDFSRTHQRLGMEDCDERRDCGRGVDANEAARLEKTRLSALEKRFDREQRCVKDKARDRGQVALLRERAIIRRQLLEIQLEEKKRQDSKKRHRHSTVQVRAASISDSRDALPVITVDLSKRRSTPLLKATTTTLQLSNEATSLADAAVPVKQQEFEAATARTNREARTKECQSVRQNNTKQHPIQSIGDNRSTRATASTQTKLLKTTKTTPSAKPASNVSSTERTVKPNTVKPVLTTNGRPQPKIERKNTAKRLKPRHPNTTLDIPVGGCRRQTHSPEKVKQVKGSPSRRSPVICSSEKISTNPVAAQSNAPVCHKTEAIRLPRATPIRDYEDALSEALSMDTDRFMMEVLTTSKPDLLDGSLSPDDNTLEALSSMLNLPHTTHGIHKCEEIASSTMDDHLTVSISMTPSEIDDKDVMSLCRLTIPDDMSPFSETEFSCLDTSRCDSKESSDLEELLKGLDTISGDSLHLLSCLSDMLTTQPLSGISGTSSPFPVDTSLDMESSTVHPETDIRTDTDPSSVHLDTIAEESNDSLPSLSISSMADHVSSVYRETGSLDDPCWSS